MKLVHNWRDFYKMWTVWLFSALTLIPLIEEQWGYFGSLVPEKYHPYVMAGFGVAGVVLRLVKQSNVGESS